MTSPLNLDGSDFPCKGLAGQIATTAPVATFLAGKTVPVTLAGALAFIAPHDFDGDRDCDARRRKLSGTTSARVHA